MSSVTGQMIAPELDIATEKAFLATASYFLSPCYSQIKRPSLASSRTGPLFFQAPKQLHEATLPNLEKECGELLQEGDELTVTDVNLPLELTLVIKWE